MKLSAIIIGLAASLPLSASAASVTALTELPMIKHVAAMPNQHVPVAEICSEKDPDQLSDWRDRRNSPCRPCVSGDERMTKAYPNWEVRPYCQ